MQKKTRSDHMRHCISIAHVITFRLRIARSLQTAIGDDLMRIDLMKIYLPNLS